MKLLKNGESGQALIIALILLTLGSLILVPTLTLVNTNIDYNRMVEKNTQELYAADAGVQYALSKLAKSPAAFGPETLPSPVNDRAINITVESMADNIYKIISTATTDGDSSTKIESYVRRTGDYSYMLDNAITSPADVTLMPGSIVNGDVQLNGELDNKGEINGSISDYPVTWPTAEEMSAFYWYDVDDLTPVPDGYTINVSSGTEENPYPVGPLYAEGSLTITGSGVVRIDGTIYVKGNLVFNPSPDMLILLNGQSIFAEGNISIQPGCTTSGSGCIVAVGSINYQPNIIGEDFVFLMAIEGTVTLQPGNSFYGSIAGDAEVYLQPSVSLNWVEPVDGLNFPGADGSGTTTGKLDVLTWQISN